MLISCIFWADCANDLHMFCMCLHILSIYYAYLACWSLLSPGIFYACFVHIAAYLRQISFIFTDFFCIFSAYLMISTHIYCILGIQMHICVYFSLQVPCKGQLLVFLIPFRFHFTATTSYHWWYQHFIAQTHSSAGVRWTSHQRVPWGLSRAGAGLCTKYVVY